MNSTGWEKDLCGCGIIVLKKRELNIYMITSKCTPLRYAFLPLSYVAVSSISSRINALNSSYPSRYR